MDDILHMVNDEHVEVYQLDEVFNRVQGPEGSKVKLTLEKPVSETRSTAHHYTVVLERKFMSM